MSKQARQRIERSGRSALWVGSVFLFLCMVNPSAGSSAATMFTETEEGQVDMVMHHGAVVSEKIHEREKEEENVHEDYDTENFNIINGQPHDSDLVDDVDTLQHLRRSVSRHKRFALGKEHVWPKAIVPYDFEPELSVFYQREILAAMTKYLRYTCIGFVPWVFNETKTEYDLPLESHVTFVDHKDGKCVAIMGNRKMEDGQFNYCCERGTCLHEIGHTLGLMHEHANPSARGFMELNWDTITKYASNEAQQFMIRKPDGNMINQYDVTHTMHYNTPGFNILYEDLRELIKMKSQFYLFKDISLYHDCQGLHCSQEDLECFNDGFVTLVNDVCSCLCPAGLDPDNGCETTIKEVTTSSVWPAGSYALLSPIDGCPTGGAVFSPGSWTHKGKGGNSMSSEFDLAGTFDEDSFQYEFCLKEDDSVDGPAWDTGRYCILRVGDQCPEGFEIGSIQFDDADYSPQTSSGKLPDGVFAEDTRMELCCRDDGYSGVPLINLPNTEPFVLLPFTKNCQEVAGMRWKREYMQFQNFKDSAVPEGTTPKFDKGKILFCYYVPVNTNCGGEIYLNSDDDQVEITSPNYPLTYGANMECTWLIIAEESGAQILLDINTMELGSDEYECQDSLEIRYNLPGQPGIRYCGDVEGRTLRSHQNIALLTLRADYKEVAEDIGFNITATIHIPEEGECFEPSTKGKLYRGHKNYTRSMRPCLDWKDVTSCPHHAFNPVDFGAGLDENYCRNPDDTDMPWCYTQEFNCLRDYCDVCNIEFLYDRKGYCSDDTCNQPLEKIIAQGCASTCNLTHPPSPDRDQTCAHPDDVEDGKLLDDQLKDEYKVGDNLTFQCSAGYDTLVRTCMSDGYFSPAGYVCGACDAGWTFHRGSCYRYFRDRENWITAQSVCRDKKAYLASMRDEEEQTFVTNLSPEKWVMWSGANDREVEGTFAWDDGTLVDWSNWYKGKPDNYSEGVDCVEVHPFWINNEWNDRDCQYLQLPFVCMYPLLEKQVCTDRHPDCWTVLVEKPDTCSTHPDFANQMCPYTCALCQPDSTPQCPISPPNPNSVLVSPEGQTSVGRGADVRYACVEGYALTSGQPILVCGEDGKLIGEAPTCEDINTLVQDSNDIDLVQRFQHKNEYYAFFSQGDSQGIFRYGVIKQWKFFTSSKGWVFFMVWRPNPAGGRYSFKLIGKVQVLTSGYGKETYDAIEADWIHVQPGDRISVFEGPKPRANIPYNTCDKNKDPQDYGVLVLNKKLDYAQVSPLKTHELRQQAMCFFSSSKAVIYPNNTVPTYPQLPTSQEALLPREEIGFPGMVFLTNSANSFIPAYGWISEWQFYVMSSGTAAFQVWRRREDKGSRKFEFIGENKVNLTVDRPHLHTLRVPEEERIAVKTGDVIAIHYGNDRLGVPFSFCKRSSNPESYRSYWLVHKGPVVQDAVYYFSYSKRFLCRTFSMRGIVTQNKQAEDEECFAPTTKGKLYRGQKNYTRSLKPCIPWAEAIRCHHSPFQARDFGDGLDKNYCRRPDAVYKMPWCYTDLCHREYCDVCNDEPVVDTASSCSDDVCEKSDTEILAAGCAATCQLQPAPAPIRAQQCEQPDNLPGSSIVLPDGQEAPYAYNVGDTVTYKCDQGEGTLTRTCVSDGKWSPGGYVCTDTCADRYPDCQSMLLNQTDACTTRTDFANQMCPLTCGVCQPDSN